MGRYSGRLAHEFARAAGVAPGQRVIDVGCGTGALTDRPRRDRRAGERRRRRPVRAVRRAGPRDVPGADLRVASAERLPFDDATFDRALSQLVFHFVDDPAAAGRRDARVTRPGGIVAACVWDMTGGMTMISAYWDAVARGRIPGRIRLERFGGQPGQLASLWREAGLHDVDDRSLTVAAGTATSTSSGRRSAAAAGPIGVHAASLEGERSSGPRGAPPQRRLARRPVRADGDRLVRGRDGLMEQRVSLITLGVRDLAGRARSTRRSAGRRTPRRTTTSSSSRPAG